ncbi:MAG: toll/interleukin-1 receptor domain-containing protein [Methylomonas sp.]|jgi:hypothetical protein|uniref:toll/interleukin-1 receptor domain-containing protein n=1 Tax=Methylomonas sp. TaxID=418 RepID=UPI0025D2C2DC|nr:toll/interleukin-1 receptor domain-containing protein [Methylomonas sp.]MCK9605911.1 toll/interleukin-1 receptor domain-containing protein [Methylomonas sp.]
MKNIFISYSRTNLEFIRTLADDLADLEYTVWYDQALTGGQLWWDNILEKIRACDVFMPIITSETIDSQACNDEIHYAKALGKSFLPVLLSPDICPSHYPKIIAEIQVVDYCKQDKHGFKLLLKSLNSARNSPPLPTPLPTPPPTPLSYLIDLRERINAPELDHQAQKVLYFDLKEAINNKVGGELAEIQHLMSHFLNRSDLLAIVAKDINNLLNPLSEAKSSLSDSPQPRTNGSDTVKNDGMQTPKASPHKETIRIPPQMVVKKAEEAVIPCQDAALMLPPTLRRVIDFKEKWQIKLDENNHLLIAPVNSLTNSTAVPDCVKRPRGGVAAILVVRDSLFEEKSRLLKKVTWEISNDTWIKTIVSSGALYLTGGLAALSLLSKSVRDELMTVTASKTWKYPNTEVELGVISHEIVTGLKIVSPEAKTYVMIKLNE